MLLREIPARKRFGIRQYDQLPGKSAVPEAIVDIVAPLLGALGLCVPLIRCVSKDFARYFDRKADYAMQVRRRLQEQLCALMDRGDRIVLHLARHVEVWLLTMCCGSCPMTRI